MACLVFLLGGVCTEASPNFSEQGLAAHRRGVERHRPGRLLEARALYEEALRAWTQAYGPDHPRVATALRHVAMIQLETGWPRQAAELLEQAAAIRRQALGDDHPETGLAMAELGAAYAALGRTGRAERLYLEAVEILGRHATAYASDYETALENLATFYLGELRFAASRPWYRELVAHRTRRLGPDHPLTERARADLAVAAGELPPGALSLRD